MTTRNGSRLRRTNFLTVSHPMATQQLVQDRRLLEEDAKLFAPDVN